MKNQKTIILFLFISLLFTGCKDLLDVEETFTFRQAFTVNTAQTTFDDARIFDLAANVDVIDEYGSKIKEVKIEKVEYWLTVFQGTEDQAFQGGSVSVSHQDGSDVTLVAALGEHSLHELLNSPQTLVPVTAGINMLGDLAADPPHRFKLHADAEVNEGPLNFVVVFEFTARMVANPLN